MMPHTHFLLGGNSIFPPVVDPSHAHDQLRVSCVGTTFVLSMVMLVTILTVRGEATLVVPEKISPVFKHEHQGIESKNNKENLANVVCGNENQYLPSSVGSILIGSRCLH